MRTSNPVLYVGWCDSAENPGISRRLLQLFSPRADQTIQQLPAESAQLRWVSRRLKMGPFRKKRLCSRGLRLLHWTRVRGSGGGGGVGWEAPASSQIKHLAGGWHQSTKPQARTILNGITVTSADACVVSESQRAISYFQPRMKRFMRGFFFARAIHSPSSQRFLKSSTGLARMFGGC